MIFFIFTLAVKKLHSIKIVSGGQTGVDRAALDFALDHQIPCGGWCPKGRKAEDGPIPERYPLQEISTASYSARTKQNVTDSDATLIIYNKIPDRGTKEAIEECLALKKPVLYHAFNGDKNIDQVLSWISYHRVRTLHIAGPRESNEPGIYKKSYRLLEELFLDEIKHQQTQ